MVRDDTCSAPHESVRAEATPVYLFARDLRYSRRAVLEVSMESILYGVRYLFLGEWQRATSPIERPVAYRPIVGSSLESSQGARALPGETQGT